ncbi:MAG: type 4a pilus biogenesis protein PilO [Candidatus Aureabacteria bacterium]|nr:type 4a pilus biogenesis protein PilO [Candidatus Auribacterota bacterium]
MKVGRNLQSIIIASVLFVGVVVFGSVVIYPSFTQMIRKKQELDKKQEEVDNVSKTIVKGMTQFKKEFEDLEKEYENLTEKLPLKNSFPELLNQISRQTEALPVEVIAINRLQEKEDAQLNVVRVPVIIDLITDYKTLGNYLKSLEDIEIAVTIRRLVIIKDEKNLVPPRLRVNLELETYVSLVE